MFMVGAVGAGCSPASLVHDVLASHSACMVSAVVRIVSRVVRISLGSRLWANVHFGLSQMSLRHFLHVVGPVMTLGMLLSKLGSISRLS